MKVEDKLTQMKHRNKISNDSLINVEYKPIGNNPASDKSIQWDWIFFIVVVCIVIPWLLSL